jgi:hypothetical protein
MHNELWDTIYQYFAAQTEIYSKFKDLDFEQQLKLLIVKDDAPIDPSIPNLIELRTELCEILQKCKDNISEQLDETKTQFVVSILAIDCDENVLTKQINKIQITQGSLEKISRTNAELKLTANWHKLQQPFAKCNNGGERFYENIDLFLEKTSVYRFLIELSYFCLAQGFHGKYLANQDAIDVYKARCLAKLTESTHFSATGVGNTSKKQNETILRTHNAAST